MKLLVLISLCAVALGAKLAEEIPPPGITVTKALGKSQFDLHLKAPYYVVTPELSEDEAQNPDFSTRLLSGIIIAMLEDLRQLIIHGNDNVPVLDPLAIDSLGPFEFRPATGVVASGTLNNVGLTGLQWFVVDRASINPFFLSLDLSFLLPALTATGSYEAEGRAILIVHKAGGDFRIFAHHLNVDIHVGVGINDAAGNHLLLRDFNILIDVHDVNISITGMTGSTLINSFISSTIQNLTRDVIQNHMEDISGIITESLYDVINDVLNNFTLDDIFDLLS